VTGPDLAAIVLAGGKGQRLGGAHKPALRRHGRSLLDQVLGALTETGARSITVVGPRMATEVPVAWTREQPPGSGPVAAVAAGLAAASPAGEPGTAELTALLAADLADPTAACLRRLATALGAGGDADCAVLTDPGGWAQWLLAVWRTAALRRCLDELAEGGLAGMPLRALYRRARVGEVPGTAEEARDLDTPAEARAAGLEPHMYWPPLTE
jgi:molybdopterin-guanine dinucleotide biosynthesis protein A